MIEIGNTLISLDIIERNFFCDLQQCKGACCLYGDSGAPLEISELGILEDIYPAVKEYLSVEGFKTLEAFGLYVEDDDCEFVTPLINRKECAYAVFGEDNILGCAIEKAFLNNKIDFRKPVSCHLYPIRINKFNNYDAVNYHKWQNCECAVRKGNEMYLPVYQFLKEPLIRKYGSEWYEKLEFTVENYLKEQRP